MTRYRWKLLPAIRESDVQQYGPLVTQLLVNRGITTPEAQEAFLSTDERLLGNPFLLPDMSRAIKRLALALKNHEKIAVYGDFDADGICGTTLLVEGLQSLGAVVIPYLPHRVEDGYGLNSLALDYLRQLGVRLVISVDCGITSFAEAVEAGNLGMDLIITDHHRPLTGKQHTVNSTQSTVCSLPPALAVIDPWRLDSLYPFPHLCGTGVAYKLLQALYQALGREGPDSRILELVAIGTVADMQPLTGENRYLVARGLKELNRTSRPGLQGLISVSGLTAGRVESGDISWVIGPRLNASGRIDHALISYNLFLSRTLAEAEEKARSIEKLNEQRQKLTEEAYEKAREQVIPDAPLIFAQGDFPQGVIGIVAGKLSREFYRPAFVVQEGEKSFRGSARSILEFDLVRALSSCEELLERYGGHPGAAGFTVAPEKVASFRERILGMAAEALAGQDLCPTISVDACFPVSQIAGDTYGELSRLEPFGQENPRPVFLSRNVSVIGEERMGKAGQHLRLKLKDKEKVMTAVGFNLGKGVPGLDRSINVDILYSLELNRWRGVETVRLELLDMEQSRDGQSP